MFEIRRYTQNKETEWNDFIRKSRQGTFLFNRQYMDYHRDIFEDFSIMVYQKNRLVALLPANIKNSTLYSHQGLTYGGLISSKDNTAALTCDIFKSINAFLKKHSVNTVIYKAIPWIYHLLPSEEDIYALTDICKARLIDRDISSTIFLDNRIKFAESRKSGIRKAKRMQLTVCKDNSLKEFWIILDHNLYNKYKVHPVHTLAEMELLKSRFPENIYLYIVKDKSEILGGTLLYITGQVVHTQYISASEKGKACGALDLLFDHLINKTYWKQKYFDFGKSTSGNDCTLNESLIFQKEGFGGRGICYDTYKWNL